MPAFRTATHILVRACSDFGLGWASLPPHSTDDWRRRHSWLNPSTVPMPCCRPQARARTNKQMQQYKNDRCNANRTRWWIRTHELMHLWLECSIFLQIQFICIFSCCVCAIRFVPFVECISNIACFSVSVRCQSHHIWICHNRAPLHFVNFCIQTIASVSILLIRSIEKYVLLVINHMPPRGVAAALYR